MYKLKVKNIIFLFAIFLFNGSSIKADIHKINNDNIVEIKDLKWQIITPEKGRTNLDWEKDNNLNVENLMSVKKSFNNNYLEIKSIGKSLVINGEYFPEISNYVPNAFLGTSSPNINTSLRGISKTRHCKFNNFDSNCIDGVLDIDFNLFNNNAYSFNPKFTFQSLSNRGTKLGEAISMGFKASKKLSKKWSIAIGGENIIHFDHKTDLGRNFYIVGSTFYPLGANKSKLNTPILFLNMGLGSDFYGYKGNGYIARTSCLGKPNLTGEGSEFCNWGPIGSVSLALNDRFAINNEWFGYGLGTGFSFKPIKNKPISLSIYMTDYIKGLPTYADEGCYNNNCETRFYGSLSASF